jgi:hypothetical protein
MMPKPDSMQEYLNLSYDEKMALFEEDALRQKTSGVHPNSAKAHREEHAKLAGRAKMILRWFEIRCSIGNVGMSDRDVKDALFGVTADMNRVRPRITELIDLGLLKETGKVKDSLTGKTVRLVGLP